MPVEPNDTFMPVAFPAAQSRVSGVHIPRRKRSESSKSKWGSRAVGSHQKPEPVRTLPCLAFPGNDCNDRDRRIECDVSHRLARHILRELAAQRFDLILATAEKSNCAVVGPQRRTIAQGSLGG